MGEGGRREGFRDGELELGDGEEELVEDGEGEAVELRRRRVPEEHGPGVGDR